MSEVSQALQKIARGTGIVFVGTVISMFLQFLSRAIIARYFSTGEYGVFNLALTILNLALVIATLGFQNALPREVAFYREREPSRVSDLVSTVLVIVTVNSIIWTVIIFASAGGIAKFFGDARLINALRIVVFALPFWALTGVIISVSRGFGRVREQVYFQNIVYPSLFLILIVVGAFLELPFMFIFDAYVVSWGITFLTLVFSSRKLALLKFKGSLSSNLGSELLKLSLPLMLGGIAGFIMTWTDTLMIGHYLNSKVVGVYNAAVPIARLLLIFLNSAGIIYPSLATILYAQKKITKLKRVYQLITKWIFLATFPLFLIIFLFPKVTIKFLFGPKYISAIQVLRILTLGFTFHIFLGPNGWTLIVIRENIFTMYSAFFSAVINITLNILLIPNYGMGGAAVATAVAYMTLNIVNSVRLYQKTKIHPFSRNYLKSATIGFILLGLIKSLQFRVLNIWYAIPVLVIILGLYFFMILLSRSIDKEDIELFLTVEKRLGINLERLKKILIKFV